MMFVRSHRCPRDFWWGRFGMVSGHIGPVVEGHKRMAYTAFWTKAPTGRKKNIPKGTASFGYEAKFEHSY